MTTQQSQILKTAAFATLLGMALLILPSLANAGSTELFDTVDKNRDGFISIDEMHQHRESRVHAMDRNRDGAIERAEFRGDDAMFTRLDRNADGVITKLERDAAALQAFQKIDENADGGLSPQEIAAIR